MLRQALEDVQKSSIKLQECPEVSIIEKLSPGETQTDLRKALEKFGRRWMKVQSQGSCTDITDLHGYVRPWEIHKGVWFNQEESQGNVQEQGEWYGQEVRTNDRTTMWAHQHVPDQPKMVLCRLRVQEKLV